MFIETHEAINAKEEILLLTFLKSLAIQAYPCGRRRSKLTLNDPGDPVYIPFDPEARLNTEANNRKYTSLNGFNQTYINSSSAKTLSLALAGYLFNIDLKSLDDTGSATPEGIIRTFGEKAATALTPEGGSTSNITKLYVNIRIQNVKLFSGSEDDSYTTVLRDQIDEIKPRTDLDVLKSELKTPTTADANELGNYYFSGLSFSAEPLTSHLNYQNNDRYTYSLEIIDPDKNKNSPRSAVNVYQKVIGDSTATFHQQIVSLCILEKSSGGWKIHEPARLPHIEHGDEKDSIVLNKVKLTDLKATDIETDNLKVNTKIDASTAIVHTKTLYQDGHQVPMLKMEEQDNGTWRMQFSAAEEVLKETL